MRRSIGTISVTRHGKDGPLPIFNWLSNVALLRRKKANMMTLSKRQKPQVQS
jgi:hypothetical protein